MQIDIVGENHIVTTEVRAYAEYRVFATLARYAAIVRSARVVLRPAEPGPTGRSILCTLTVFLEPSGFVRVRARRPVAHGAINRAADRLSELMSRRTAQRTTAETSVLEQ